MSKNKVTHPAGDDNAPAPATPSLDFGPDAAGNGAPPRQGPPTAEAAGAAPDPFDPASLRLSQDFAANLGVKKALVTVPVRKPDKAWFVRVHPDEGYSLQTCVIELKEDREIYLVAPALWPALAGEPTLSPRALFTAVNKQGVVFLWPVRLPGADGKLDSWSQSALEAARMARAGWVRVTANMSLGAYEVFQATGSLEGPQWPEASFRDLLHTAFKDRRIDALDHLVLRRLRGEA